MDNLSTELAAQIGQRLSDERKRLQLTQKQVCEVLDIGAASLSRYEQGKRMLDILQACEFAALGYDMQYVMTGAYAGQAPSLSDAERQLLTSYRGANDPALLSRLVDAFIAAEK